MARRVGPRAMGLIALIACVSCGERDPAGPPTLADAGLQGSDGGLVDAGLRHRRDGGAGANDAGLADDGGGLPVFCVLVGS